MEKKAKKNIINGVLWTLYFFGIVTLIMFLAMKAGAGGWYLGGGIMIIVVMFFNFLLIPPIVKFIHWVG